MAGNIGAGPTSIKSTHLSNTSQISDIRRWWLYASDWLTIIIVVAVSQIILIPAPRSQRFQVTDPNIQQVNHDDHVNINRMCVVLMTAIPVVAIILWCGYNNRPFHVYHHGILGLGTSISFAMLFLSISKQATVQLSADFIDVCAPTPDAYRRAFLTGRPLSTHDCTTSSRNKLKQSMRCYPYVSSALACSSMGYLGLFLSKELGLRLHPNVHPRLQLNEDGRSVDTGRQGQTLTWFICLLPYAAGMTFPAVATEHRGGVHGWEVVSGIIIGTIFAIWGHVLYVVDIVS